MSRQHTPGRLFIVPCDAPKATLMIASDQDNTGLIATMEHGKSRMPDYHQAEANAHRLVACWNMLVGETTEDIEANPLPAMFDQLSVHLEQLQKNCDKILAEHKELLAQAQELHRQRDELLAALKHIEGVAMADEWRDLPEIAKHARAAIAKAEGVQHGK